MFLPTALLFSSYSMVMVMRLFLMTRVVMFMGLKLNGVVLVLMSLFAPLMTMVVCVTMGMRMRMLIVTRVGVFSIRVLVGMFVIMPMFVLMIMGVAVLPFHVIHLLSQSG